jgi:ribosomal protein S1
MQVYSVKDLYPGQTLEVSVLDSTPGGLVVAITQNLKGLVPKLHMTDSGGAEPKASKFKPGKKLAARWVVGEGGCLWCRC